MYGGRVLKFFKILQIKSISVKIYNTLQYAL